MWKDVVVVKFTVDATIWPFPHGDLRKNLKILHHPRPSPGFDFNLKSPIACPYCAIQSELLDTTGKSLITQPLMYAFIGQWDQCLNAEAH